MAGVNKAIIVGRLGKEPVIKQMQNGQSVASLTVATSDVWKDKTTGERRERTEWHRVVIFGKLAEIAGQYLHKGSQVYIEGKLQTRKWQNQQGQDQYTTEIVLQGFDSVMQMLDRKSDNPNNSFNQNQGGQQQNNQQQANNQNSNFTEPPMDFDDDIPF